MYQFKGKQKMLIISLKKVSKNEQHDYAHKLLSVLLRKNGIEYGSETKIEYGDKGKPFLAEYPDVYYNLTHADGITACLVCGRECGIDAEPVKKVRPAVIRRAFSENEQRIMDAVPEQDKAEMFTRFWTLKEAYVKTLGIGISYPLDKVEFAFEDKKIVTNIKGYEFVQYILCGGKYIVSYCIKE